MISVESLFEAAFKAACGALDETVQEIYTESTEEQCPVDTGEMKASAKNELVADSETEHTREISYNTDYAIYPHERLNLHHNHGSAKFLETPATQNEDKLIKHMISAVRDSLEH